MRAIFSDTIRGLVRQVNELGIKKEDIIGIYKEGTQYVLIYFD